MIDIHQLQSGEDVIFHLKFDGILTEAQYQVFLPHFESEVRHHKNLRLLFDLGSGLGWEARSPWRTLRFDSRHHTDIAKLGIVGNRAWHDWIVKACSPMNVRRTFLFARNQREFALSWIEQ